MEEERNYCVYMHQNKINGKRYIGLTKTSTKRRWRNSGYGYKKNVAFWNAIQKYGWENFNHFVLFDNLTKQEACQKEIELIKLYKSHISENGYNVTWGGDCGIDYEHHPEYLDAISNRMKGKPACNRRKIICINTLEIFNSLTLATSKYNVSVENICACCNNKKLSAGKCDGVPLIWRYYNKNINYNSIKDDIIYKVLNATKGKNHHSVRTIVCITTEKIFDTARDALRYYNLAGNSLNRVCKNQDYYFGEDCDGNKLYWAYYDDYIYFNQDYINEILAKSKNKKNKMC